MNLNFPYKTTDLGDGLQLMTIPMPTPSVTVAIFAGVGSRYELSEHSGISHVIEHMAFKGTTNRPTQRDISVEIASLGGDSNAGTGYEFTYYYVKMPSYQWEKALDIVSDLTLNPTHPAEELEKEKSVILQEYKMYQDNPQQKLIIDFRKMIWPNHPLGEEISGTPETITGITREAVLNFRNQYYVRNNLLIAICGDIDQSKAETFVRSYFQDLAAGERVKYPEVGSLQPADRVLVIERAQESVDLVIGFKGLTRQDQQKLDKLGLLNTVLGVGATSRLFQHVREDLGLTYYIGSGHTDYQDDGLFYIRAGVAKERIADAIQAILKEIRLVVDTEVDQKELKTAQEYSKGSLLLDLETSDDVLRYFAFQQLLDPEVRTPQAVIERIDELTAEDLQSVAREVFAQAQPYVGIIGPVGEVERDEIQKLIE